MSLIEDFNIPENHLLKIASLNLLNYTATHFPERVELLKRELKDLNTPILCLQEVVTEDREYLSKELAELGYEHASFGSTVLNGHGTAIFSKNAPKYVSEIKAGFENEIGTTLNVFDINNQEVHVLSAHFVFGSENRENLRTRQAIAATDYAVSVREENKDAIILLLGDLNAVPTSDTVMFLNGSRAIGDRATIWVDSFEYVGDPEDWVTSDHSTYWGLHTSKNTNNPIYPLIGRKRRIDYIFSHGWRYGNPGTPLTYKTWGHLLEDAPYEVSDHFGVYAEILCP